MNRMIVPLALAMVCAVTTTSNKAQNGNTDSTKKEVSKILPYNKVITDKAVTDSGFVIVHKVNERYYFEIPDSVFDTDILIVNRISKGAVGNKNQGFGYGGDQIGSSVIRFEKGPVNKVFIKQMSYTSEVSKDSSANGMYRAVKNSTVQPIVYSFDIKAFALNSSAPVIDVTDIINTTNSVLSPAQGVLQLDKSYTQWVHSFPINIEIRTVKTFMDAGIFKTLELNSSLVLLPTEQMHSRYNDDRVGYFSSSFIDFDKDPQEVRRTAMINRWRLEPKLQDLEKYKRGELVEPQKPIVFYIDPATPKKWVPYLIQGVNDWQVAFEQAGFKNAIYALEAPIGDSTWSLEDARHNAIVYKASDIQNASGPVVIDPRSGEILETHVNWYHNVMQLLHDWYMVQAGAIDPRARTMEFDDSLMGQLIRFVSSHEIGHTLGLQHNFGSSSTVPVDSLRSKRWVEANGHTPSIMDYARFNYVAQPEDSITEKGIFPRIGVYDKWAIEWGYRLFPDIKNDKEEKSYLKSWIVIKLRTDKRLLFSSQFNIFDPRAKSEDLGDDAVKASEYGIKNLKRILPQLPGWTQKTGDNYDDLRRMQKAVYSQYTLYLFHVSQMIGGIYYTPRTSDEQGTVYDFPSIQQQKRSVEFLNNELFKTPTWLLDKHIFIYTGVGTPMFISGLQRRVLNELLSGMKIANFAFADYYSAKAYSVDAYLNDLETEIWSELEKIKPIDQYRRSLQKIYISKLDNLINKDLNSKELFIDFSGTDVNSIIKDHLSSLISKINKAFPHYKDHMTQIHLKECRDRLRKSLRPEEKGVTENSENSKGLVQDSIKPKIIINSHEFFPCFSHPNELNESIELK